MNLFPTERSKLIYLTGLMGARTSPAFRPSSYARILLLQRTIEFCPVPRHEQPRSRSINRSPGRFEILHQENNYTSTLVYSTRPERSSWDHKK